MSKLNTIFQGGFDATAVAPDAGRDFAPLPAGAYEAEITGSEVKENSAKTGCYLKLEFTVIGPTHTGRKVWANITLRNASQKAEEIGHGQLSALCHAVNIPRLDDSDQLFQKIVRIRLKIKPAEGNYQAGNDVTGYEAVGSAASSPSAARPAANAAPAAAAAPAAGAKKAPWAK